MKTLIPLITGFFIITDIAQAQDAKAHLRDFTPNYAVDTFTVKGNPGFLKRRVISFQKVEGIRSAYWDDANNVLTVQYNQKLVQLSAIKNFFLNEQPLVFIDQRPVGKTSYYGSIKPYPVSSKNRK